ncbi:MAG: DUF5777 family beta-barrel protein [Ferruginibacter sp.]
MRTFLLFAFLSFMANALYAQDTTDVLAKLEMDPKRIDYTFATFKSTRLINGHSVENIGKGVLDVRILHRFAPLNTGIYNFFGLDQASMRMGFDYGFTNNFMIGVGHSTWEKTYDAFFKIKLLRQSTGAVNMPITVSYVPTIAVRTNFIGPDHLPAGQKRIHTTFLDKSSFTHQLIIGRKFSQNFSLQLMPTYIHHHNRIDSIAKYTRSRDNYIYGEKRKNTVALGIGGRLKVSKRISLNAEYYYQLPDTRPDNWGYNCVSFGVDIETGGHVFQLHFTNSNGMTEKSFITDTDNKWRDGSIRFGFNLSRVFNIGKHH